MKVAILTAAVVLDASVHAGAVIDVPNAVARQLAKEGVGDLAEAAIAYRESEGEKVITLPIPAAAPPEPPAPPAA